MTPEAAKQAIIVALKANVPVFLWGPPGIGKSELTHQVGAHFEVPVVDVRAAQLDPVDLRGIPSVKDGRTHWNPPAILDIGKPAFLFLDELPQAPLLVQAALFQLVLDRCVGDLKLHPGVRIIAAGNRMQDRSATNRMPAALANRFVHIEVEADLKSWLNWAAQNGIAEEIIAFLRFRPDLLSKFDPEARENPTPRTWTFVNQIIANAGRDIAQELVAGAVGPGAATEFAAYLRLYNTLTTFEQILDDPASAPVPNAADQLFAISSMLAARIDDSNAKPCFAYISRLPADFQAATVAILTARTPDIQRNGAFLRWSQS